MSCECFYIPKENTLKAARSLAKEIDRIAIDHGEEAYPVGICKTLKGFSATYFYNNIDGDFEVEDGRYMVAVFGKYYCLDRINPENGVRAFPSRKRHRDIVQFFSDYIQDIEAVKKYIRLGIREGGRPVKKLLTTETISQQDVAKALTRFHSACPSDEEGNEGALRFASELLGVSEDQIWELMQETV